MFKTSLYYSKISIISRIEIANPTVEAVGFIGDEYFFVANIFGIKSLNCQKGWLFEKHSWKRFSITTDNETEFENLVRLSKINSIYFNFEDILGGFINLQGVGENHILLLIREKLFKFLK